MRIIGLMSGTSGDGIDAALIELQETVGGRPSFSLRSFLTRSYGASLRARIFSLFDPATATIDELCRVNFLVGEAFADTALAVMADAGLSPSDIDLIGSHGQTIYHLPPGAPDEQGAPSTLQIGEPAVIAERTGVTTVADFRKRDMAAGGQGAPLVPYVDWWLFRDNAKSRAVQNIGGIGNVTWLPTAASIDEVLAFDTGPGNMIIDAVVESVTEGGLQYDEGGCIAASGTVHDGLLRELMAHPYFTRRPPKSTGREEFGRAFGEQVLTRGRELGLSDADIVASTTMFTAQSIADQYRRFLVGDGIDEILIGGGGAFNPTLVGMISQVLPNTVVRRHEDVGLPSEAKEAVAFALLAQETMLGHPTNVPSATGAVRPVVLGCILPGNPDRG